MLPTLWVRPRWAVLSGAPLNPANGEIYMTLTNNSSANRTPVKTDAANPVPMRTAMARRVRATPTATSSASKETDGASTAVSFKWDIFLFGSEEDAAANINLSGLTASNAFSSPDGLWFSKATGICWIQTDDGATPMKPTGNAAGRHSRHSGRWFQITVDNKMTVSGAEVTGKQETFIGAALGDAKLRRFLVAPKGAEGDRHHRNG